MKTLHCTGRIGNVRSVHTHMHTRASKSIVAKFSLKLDVSPWKDRERGSDRLSRPLTHLKTLSPMYASLHGCYGDIIFVSPLSLLPDNKEHTDMHYIILYAFMHEYYT